MVTHETDIAAHAQYQLTMRDGKIESVTDQRSKCTSGVAAC